MFSQPCDSTFSGFYQVHGHAHVIDAVARGASTNKLLSHDFTMVTYYEHNKMGYKTNPIVESADQTHHYVLSCHDNTLHCTQQNGMDLYEN